MARWISRVLATGVSFLTGTVLYAQSFVSQPLTFNPLIAPGQTVTPIDFDNDGDLDVFVNADVYEYSVRFYRNDNGTFNLVSDPIHQHPDSLIRFHEFGDIDGDADIDLLFARKNGSLMFALNQGNFSFSLRKLGLYPEFDAVESKIVDIDHDGDYDILSKTNSPFYQAILNNNGTYVVTNNLMPEVQRISLADMNNDGLQDMVGMYGPTPELRILINQGGGSFTLLEHELGITGPNLERAHWSDIDADGDLDFFLQENFFGDWAVYRNTFIPEGTPRLVRTSTFTSLTSADLGDVTGDGLPDIVTGSRPDKRIYRNNSLPNQIQFVLSQLPAEFAEKVDLHLADFDGDSDLDIYHSQELGEMQIKLWKNQSSPVASPPPPTNPAILRDTRSVRLSWDAPAITGPVQYRLELTRDGVRMLSPLMLPNGKLTSLKPSEILHLTHHDLFDLPEGAYTWQVRTVNAALRGSAGSASGQFTIIEAPANLHVEAGDNLSQVRLSWTYPSTPESFAIIRKSQGEYVVIGEVAGSEREFTDLSVPLHRNLEYSIKAKVGEEYSAPSEGVPWYATQFTTQALLTGQNNLAYRGTAIDFDNDGDMDIVYTNGNSNWSIEVLLNDGTGSFSTQVLNIPGQRIQIRDMNLDNQWDLVVGDGQYFRVYLNNQGTFNSVFSFYQAEILQFDVQDYNADGRLDFLILYSPLEDLVLKRHRLFYQQPNGQFEDSGIRLSSDFTREVGYFLAGDFNGDNHPDLMIRNVGLNGKGKILKGVAGPGFDLVSDAAELPLEDQIFDFNQDGIPDLLGLNNGIRVMVGNGAFGFTYQSTLPLTDAGYAFGLQIQNGDFDLNGIPDLLYSLESGGFGFFYGFANAHYSPLELALPWTNGSPPVPIDLEHDGDLDMVKFGQDQWDALNNVHENLIISTESSVSNEPPNIPAGLQYDMSIDGIRFSWQSANDDHSPPFALSYNLKIENEQGAPILESISSADGTFMRRYQSGNSGNELEQTTVLLPAGNYSAMVQSIDAAYQASQMSTPVSFTILPGPSPITIERILLNKIKLNWGTPYGLADQTFIQRRTQNGSYQVLAVLQGAVTSFVDSTLQYNQVYYYRVSAIASGSFTAYSTVVTWDSNIFKLQDSGITGNRAVAVVDINADGVMDVLTSGPGIEESAVFVNTGSGFSRSALPSTGSYVLGVQPVEINADGLPDILQSYSVNLSATYRSFQNQGNNTFELQPSLFSQLNEGPLFYADLDADNDMDIGFPNSTYRNDGGGAFTSIDRDPTIPWTRIADFDNDGDDDALGYDDGLFIYENDHGVFRRKNEVAELTGPVFMIDFNSDGLTDFMSGNQLHKNLGKDNGLFRFQLSHQLSQGESWADVDNDGDKDLLANGTLYLNSGSSFVPSGTFPSGGIWIDLDNDTDLDLLVPEETNASTLKALINQVVVNGNSGISNLPPGLPTNLSVTQDEYGFHFTWEAPTDDHTPSSALTYDVVINIDGGRTKADIRLNSGIRTRVRAGRQTQSLWLQSLPEGTYTWKVQAIDDNFAASVFSPNVEMTALPAAPLVKDTLIYRCGRTVNINAIGQSVEWYGDAGLTNLVATGVFHPTVTQTVYATQTINGTRSAANIVTVTIVEKPAPPVPERDSIEFCPVGNREDMYAFGDNIRWYNSPSLTTPLWTYNSYSVPGTPGSKTFYVTQTLQGCESNPATVNLVQTQIDTEISFRNDSLLVAERSGTNYQWFRNEGLIQEGPHLFGIKLTGVGTYHVIVWKGDCGRISNDVSIRLVTGIDEFITGDTLIVYPNPVRDLATVILPENPGGQLSIVDNLGRVIYERTGLSSGETELQIPTSTWAEGLYLIYYNDTKRKFAQRLVKNSR